MITYVNRSEFRETAWRRKRSAAFYLCSAVLVLTMAGTKGYSQMMGNTGAASVNSGASTSMKAPADDTSIRPFHIHFSDEALADLHQRLVNTRFPEKELVADQSQGVQLKTMKELVEYWRSNYDWRKAEGRLNSVPEYITTIDGVDIQFIWVRSKHPNALPVIITHGWPGSVIEQLKIIDPLTNPTAHAGRAEDAFDVVIPSLPGYGFSGKPTTTGWNADRIARAWGTLMTR